MPGEESVGEVVRALREGRNMSQERLAQLAKLSPGMISFVETGRRNPGRDTIIGISQALGVDPIDLLEMTGQATAADKLAAGRISFDEFVDSDYRLRTDQKKVLKDLYASYVGRSASE